MSSLKIKRKYLSLKEEKKSENPGTVN